MKHSALFCFLLWIPFTASADEFEKNFGKGVIHINTDSTLQVEFYSAPGSAVSHRLFFTGGAWAINSYIAGMDTGFFIPPWFQALFMMKSAEYSRVDIIGVDSLNGYYRTILKDDEDKEVWVKKTKQVSFLTWFGFYRTVATIELVSRDLILHDEPFVKSHRVNYSAIYQSQEHETMRPLEVKGYWMKVEIQFPDADPKLPWHVHSGWIQWRDEKQPLVTYNLMGC